MAGIRATMRDVGIQAASMGARVAKGVVRRVAGRIASRLRDQVDLENEPPSRPAPEPDRPSNLVVTPPLSGKVGSRVPSTPAAAAQTDAPQPAHAWRLFERVRVRRPGQEEVTGEIYEVRGASFDILTYTADGLPKLLSGLGREGWHSDREAGHLSSI